MLDDLNKRVRCFYTRAGFEKLAGAESLPEHELCVASSSIAKA
jgi:hypothetical protein